VPLLGEDHLRPRIAAVVLEHELVFAVVEVHFCRRWQSRALGIAEREIVVLDGEDVREIVPDLECQLERHRVGHVVVEHEAVLHALTDEAVPRNRDGVLREVARDRVAEEERGRVVLDFAGREEERALAVDRQREQREEARVVREEAARRPAEVAVRVADAEIRAFEDRDRH
jgi:hypothetical protein